jgi:hypothetical protein
MGGAQVTVRTTDIAELTAMPSQPFLVSRQIARTEVCAAGVDIAASRARCWRDSLH